MAHRLSPTLTISLALSLFLVGCEADPRELTLSQREIAIVNGTVDKDHPAVGVLRNGMGTACTATLIGHRTVLTAGHCVTGTTPPYTIHEPLTFAVGSEDGPQFQAAQVFLHPDYQGANKADLALVRLTRDVPGVSPMAISQLAVRQGEAVELVGFGKTGETEGSFGVKHKAQNVIGGVEEQLFVVFGAVGSSGNLCNGDSGGPTFATRGGQETLIGVHSSKGGACGQEGYDTRVDAFYGWVLEAAGGDVTTVSDLDQGDPEVAFVSPLQDSRVASRFMVQVKAEDDLGIARVELYVNGELRDERLHAPFSFELEQPRAGQLELQVVAYDPAGRQAVQQIAVTVDLSLAPQLAQDGAGRGSFGDSCELAADCESLLCIASQQGSICSSSCYADAECADDGRCAGGVCLPALPSAGSAGQPATSEAAEPESSGGCSVAGASGSSWSWLLLALLALARRRRG